MSSQFELDHTFTGDGLWTVGEDLQAKGGEYQFTYDVPAGSSGMIHGFVENSNGMRSHISEMAITLGELDDDGTVRNQVIFLGKGPLVFEMAGHGGPAVKVALKWLA